MPQKKRLGYWLSERKCKKLSLPDIEEALSDRNVEAVKIDLYHPLENQGHFDGILHKLTDIIVEASLGIEEAQRLLDNIEKYVRENPHVVIIDPINSLKTLIDRFKTYTIIKNSELRHENSVFVPPFIDLEMDSHEENVKMLRYANVTFPLVCKPIIAHGTRTSKDGTSSAHQMVLVFNENGLSECSYPCVVQSFVNHNAILYKLFCIGDRYFMVERPSIKNLYFDKERPSIHFDSGEISKACSTNKLTVVDGSILKEKRLEPQIHIMDNIVYEIHKSLGLGLFGVDVVIEASTGRHAIIDINAFPGYDGVDSFPDHLAEFIKKELEKMDNDLDSQNVDKVYTDMDHPDRSDKNNGGRNPNPKGGLKLKKGAQDMPRSKFKVKDPKKEKVKVESFEETKSEY